MKPSTVIALFVFAATLGWRVGGQTTDSNVPTMRATAITPPKVGDTVSVTLSNGSNVVGKIFSLDSSRVWIIQDGRGWKLTLAELSPDDQRRFGFDSAAAAKVEDTLRQQQLAEQAYQRQLAQSVEQIRINGITNGQGTPVYLAEILHGHGEGGARKMIITGIPDQVRHYLESVRSLEEQIAALSAQARSDQSTADSADKKLANAVRADKSNPSVARYIRHNPNYNNAVHMQKDGVASMKQNAEAEKKSLSALEHQLSELKSSHPTPVIKAFPTGQSYAGVPVWQCVQ